MGEEVFCGGRFDGPTRIKEKLRTLLQAASTYTVFSVLNRLVNNLCGGDLRDGGAMVN